MDATARKDLRNDSESRPDRKRRNPELRISASCKRERKRRPNAEIEQNATPSRSHTALYDLPMEVLDMILQKSYILWILNSPIKQRDEEIVRSLMSVDVCFNQRITRKRSKISIWRYWKDIYGKTKKSSAIIKSNRNYLLENIQPTDKLIASLLSLNCITQEQSQLIQRQISTQDKNDKLLYVTKSFDEAKFSNFVECLRQSNQNTVTRIMENGGGTAKIEFQTLGAKCIASAESQLLHKKIEDLRHGAESWSHKTYELMSQLKEEGIEILNSQLERQTVVVWIWCRSQAALGYIQKLYESNLLRDVLFENIETPISTLISIDDNQFKKTIVVCAFSISFVNIIKIQENVYVRRVTKLRNEIYVSSQSSSVPYRPAFQVFEDQNPFNWKKNIELTGIQNPRDIGSNERENCLYVTEYAKRCVWKITIEGDGTHKIIKWLTTHQPTSLSVSTDGQLLVLNELSSSLMIYGSDADLIRSIQLSTDIVRPQNAVKTSIGNFIILHQWIQEEGEGQWIRRKRVKKWGICELSSDGQMVIRRFIPSNETQQLNDPSELSIDSEDRVLVVDENNDRVILLDSDLRWNRIIIPTREKDESKIHRPMSLYYDEGKNQLIVVPIIGGSEVNVYSLTQK